MLHKELGKVEVLSPVPGSRTKVNIKVTQRAKGWNELQGRYEPVVMVKPNLDLNGKEVGKTIERKLYSDRHSQFGHKDVCHINRLTEIR